MSRAKSSGSDVNSLPSLNTSSTNKQEKVAPLRLSHVLLPNRIASFNSSSSNGNTSSRATGTRPQSVSLLGFDPVRFSVEGKGHNEDDIVRLGSCSIDWHELLSKTQASDAQQQGVPAAALDSLSLAELACSRHSWDGHTQAQHIWEGPLLPHSLGFALDAPARSAAGTCSDSWHSCDADLCCCEEEDSQPARDSNHVCSAVGAAASQLQPHGVPADFFQDLSPTRRSPAAGKHAYVRDLNKHDGKPAGGYLSAAAVAGTDVGAVLSTRLGLCHRLSFLKDQQSLAGSRAASHGRSCLKARWADPPCSELTESSLEAEVVLQPLLHTHTLLASWDRVFPVVSATARVPRGCSGCSRNSMGAMPVLGASCSRSGQPQTGGLTKCPQGTDSNSSTEWWHRAALSAPDGPNHDVAALLATPGSQQGGERTYLRQAPSCATKQRSRLQDMHIDGHQPDAVLTSRDAAASGMARATQQGLSKVELQAAVVRLGDEKAAILEQLSEMVEIYHSQQRELAEAEEHKATLKERCQELELQLTEAHFDREELEGLLDAQADAALQEAAVQEFKHRQQVKALQQQCREVLALLAAVGRCNGSEAMPASCAVAQHPFIQTSAAVPSTRRLSQQQQQQQMSQPAAGPLTAAKQRSSSSRGDRTACRDSYPRRGSTAGASCTGPMTAAKQRQQDCLGCAGSVVVPAAASCANITVVGAAQRDQSKSRQVAQRMTGR